MARMNRVAGGVIAGFALCLLAGAPALVAAENPVAPVRVQDVPSGGDGCFKSSATPVLSEHGWSIFLRRVALNDGVVVVSLSMRNRNARSGLIALAPDVPSHTRLIDPRGGDAYPVSDIEGIEVRLQKVERNTSASVRFTFPRPGDATMVTFNSTLVTPIMRGAGQKLQLAVPVALPVDCEN